LRVSRVPDALQRSSLLRGAGTQQATALVDAWAPALQRTVEETLRCVRGTRPVSFAHAASARHCERSEAIQESFRRDHIWSVILRCEACDANASQAEPRRMNGRGAAGLSPFEGR